MTDDNSNDESIDKLKHHTKAAAAELGKAGKEAADKLGREAKEQYEKLSPKAKELAGKAKGNPKIKLVAGLAALVVIGAVVFSMLPGGPSGGQVAEALKAKLVADAEEQNKIAVSWFGGQQQADQRLAESKKAIEDMNIDVEVTDAKEHEDGSWTISAYTMIDDGHGGAPQGGDRVYTMRKGKNGWRMSGS